MERIAVDDVLQAAVRRLGQEAGPRAVAL